MFVEIASLYAGEYIVFCLSWEEQILALTLIRLKTTDQYSFHPIAVR